MRHNGIQSLKNVLNLLARWFNKAAAMLLIEFLHLTRVDRHFRGLPACIEPELLAFSHRRSMRLFRVLNMVSAGVNNRLPGFFY